MDLFDIAVARKLSGGGGGGGGSSDFSTATVTIVDEDRYPVDIDMATIRKTYTMGGRDGWADSGELTAILYQNSAVVRLNTQSRTITVSGAIEDIGDNAYLITGDCTITVS